ncbi:MAG: alpha-glucosidase (family GH31 glycosyl hydrolase) [Alphaproteobacteria bacterium]|jgi:alpha-glucosidase (family GH31 glycosyl hydrolase)
MDYPSQSISRTDAYLWGDAFLVAPEVEQGQIQKEVVLPKGVWFDYWQNTRIECGVKHIINTPLDTLPVLVKWAHLFQVLQICAIQKRIQANRYE